MLGTEDCFVIEVCSQSYGYILKSKLCFLYIVYENIFRFEKLLVKIEKSLFDSELHKDLVRFFSCTFWCELSASLGLHLLRIM